MDMLGWNYEELQNFDLKWDFKSLTLQFYILQWIYKVYTPVKTAGFWIVKNETKVNQIRTFAPLM